MIAAVYARKSTDQNLPDAEKSVSRQVEHARAYAARKGWTVADDYVYADDGISGAEFSKRPGFLPLMNALKPRPPFQILVMSEESRLGREQIETAYALKQLITAGVRVFFYLEDRERTLDSATDKVMLALTAFADELEREKARQRTHDALIRKARAGYVTGGIVYGYDNVEARDAAGRRQRVVRRVNAEQAAIVRRIFMLYADGYGYTRIAKRLNAEGKTPARHGHGWAPTAIREILLRTVYRGELLWNRTRKRDPWGRKRQLARPESDWLRFEASELRIVDDGLWQRVQTRMTAALAAARSGRPPLDRPDEKYLLSGIARCGFCGGSLAAFTRGANHRTRGRFYGCMFHHKRGPTVCRNRLLISQDRLDRVVRQALAKVLEKRIVAKAVARAIERSQNAQRRAPNREAELRAEPAAVETQIRNVVAAIALGKPPDALVTYLHERQSRKQDVTAALEAHRTARPPDPRRVRENIQAQAADIRELILNADVSQARRLFRKLLVGRLICQPFEDARGRRGYRFTGDGSYEAMLSESLLAPTLVVAPGGWGASACRASVRNLEVGGVE
jgi:site-specific DNA recombinase